MPTADSYARMNTPLAKPKSSLFYKQGAATYTPSSTSSTAVAPIAGTTGGDGGGGGYDGGYGGGGGYSAPAPAAPARRSLASVIDEDFALRQQREENARLEQEYGAETGRLRGETEREQGVRRTDLATDLEDMTLDSSESLASRGLLHSGGFFLNNDKIDAEGARRESSIADMLTNLLSQRGQGLLGVQAQGRNSLNDRIAQITQQYGMGVGGY